MKRDTPSMFRDVPESEKPVGVSIGELTNRVVGKIDAGRKELAEAADRNRARIAENGKILKEGK